MAQRTGRELKQIRMLLLILACATLLLSALRPSACAQTASSQSAANSMPDWQKAAGGRRTFIVATVSQSQPRDNSTDLNLPSGSAPTGDIFTTNGDLMSLIVFAYKITDFRQFPALSAQLPGWARSDTFAIEARSDVTPTRDQLRLMVQSLLADRFKLAVHHQMREQVTYALVLDKPGELGRQLKPRQTNDCKESDSAPNTTPASAISTMPPLACPVKYSLVNGEVQVRMINVTMEQAASYLATLAGASGGAVGAFSGVNETGLTGHFDISLEFSPGLSGPGSSGPNFGAALKHELGLKLVERASPTDVIVIDHVEHLSTN